jgi:hypothetical protein
MQFRKGCDFVEFNFYALAVSIITGCSPEQAFYLLETGHKMKDPNYFADELADMASLRGKGVTWREIGEIFGISRNAAFKRMHRALAKVSA